MPRGTTLVVKKKKKKRKQSCLIVLQRRRRARRVLFGVGDLGSLFSSPLLFETPIAAPPLPLRDRGIKSRTSALDTRRSAIRICVRTRKTVHNQYATRTVYDWEWYRTVDWIDERSIVTWSPADVAKFGGSQRTAFTSIKKCPGLCLFSFFTLIKPDAQLFSSVRLCMDGIHVRP